MGVADELEKLTRLRESGALSAEEFEKGKGTLLGHSPAVTSSAPSAPAPKKASMFAIRSPIVIILLLVVLIPVSINLFSYLFHRGPTGIPSIIGPQVLADERLNIGDGGGVTYTLQKGSYRVEVDAKAGGNHGVTLAWTGASCPAQQERQRHDVNCEVTAANTKLTIANPSLLGMGGAAIGHVRITKL